jgi:hypothetical protein
MVAIQKGHMIADCFMPTRLVVYDGRIKVYQINSHGKVIEEAEGFIREGNFKAEGTR